MLCDVDMDHSASKQRQSITERLQFMLIVDIPSLAGIVVQLRCSHALNCCQVNITYVDVAKGGRDQHRVMNENTKQGLY